MSYLAKLIRIFKFVEAKVNRSNIESERFEYLLGFESALESLDFGDCWQYFNGIYEMHKLSFHSPYEEPDWIASSNMIFWIGKGNKKFEKKNIKLMISEFYIDALNLKEINIEEPNSTEYKLPEQILFCLLNVCIDGLQDDIKIAMEEEEIDEESEFIIGKREEIKIMKNLVKKSPSLSSVGSLSGVFDIASNMFSSVSAMDPEEMGDMMGGLFEQVLGEQGRDIGRNLSGAVTSIISSLTNPDNGNIEIADIFNTVGEAITPIVQEVESGNIDLSGIAENAQSILNSFSANE